MNDDDALVYKSAVEQAALLRAGQLSSRELVEAHLARIAAVNPELNAIVTLTEETARAQAADADAAHAAGQELGPIHGLPTAFKDSVPTAGVRTTFGSPLMDRVPDTDALIVERTRAAGAVMVGKTNLPEFGAGSQTFNEIFGPTANPYDPTRTCGGSSGGAAVAIATGMVPFADGSDVGGSLRNPASFCNIVGFRPSPGRVPGWPKAAHWSPLATEGPMARTVDDLALLLSVQAGPDRRTPVALESPGAAFAPPIDPAPPGLRIAWAPDLGGLPIDPVVREALDDTPSTFESLGHAVHTACPDLHDSGEIFRTLRAANYAQLLGDLFEAHGDAMKQTVQQEIRRGLDLTIDELLRAGQLHAELFERVAQFFDGYDFLLCPVAQVPPFDLDVEWIAEIDGVPMPTYVDWMRVCSDVTLMNCPAISVPAAFTDDGLPIGLQIVGPPRADLAVLRLARQFEQATEVGRRRPPLAEG